MARTTRGIRGFAVLGALGLTLAACAPDAEDEDTDPAEVEQPDDPADDTDDADDLGDTDPDTDGVEDDEDAATEEDDETAADDGAEDSGSDEAQQDEGVAALDVDATTDISEREALDARMIVTDVRVGTHDGFDRVTIELDGEGEAGWFAELTDEPTSQGSGEPIEFEGEHALWVAVSTVVLPGDEPEGVDEDARIDVDLEVAGPEGGVVTEVVGDTLFEGLQTFAIGLDEERAYRIERFEDPERVVIDVVHD